MQTSATLPYLTLLCTLYFTYLTVPLARPYDTVLAFISHIIHHLSFHPFHLRLLVE